MTTDAATETAAARCCWRVAATVVVASAVGMSCGGAGRSAPVTTATTAPPATVAASTAPAVSTTRPARSAQSTTVAPKVNIVALAKADGSLTTLLRLLDTTGLTDTLLGPGSFSLLAPTDAAFAAMDKTTLDKITNDPALLKRVLQYHLVAKQISSFDVTDGSVTTVEGSAWTLQATSTRPTVNGVTVVRATRATNGALLVVESVLIPPDVTLS